MKATLDSSEPGRWRLSGDLDFDSVCRLLEPARAAFADGGAELVVDLGEVGRCNSAGLALLIEWMRWSAEAGGRIGFDRIPDALCRLASISGLELPQAAAEPPT